MTMRDRSHHVKDQFLAVTDREEPRRWRSVSNVEELSVVVPVPHAGGPAPRIEAYAEKVAGLFVADRHRE